MVVCCDEDDGRKALVLQGFKYGETADLGHLHVEQDKVGTKDLYCLNGLRAVRAFADDADFGVAGGHAANLFARERLVVHDKDADGSLSGGVRHQVGE